MSSKFIPPLLTRRSGSRKMGLFFASALCFSGMAVVKFREAVEATGNVCAVENPTKLFLLRLLFGRLRSRVVGEVLSKPLPPALMHLGVLLLDALNPKALGEIRYPVESYRTLGDLFSRTLKDGSREIKDLSPSAIVSPCDCTVMFAGQVEGDRVPQVKGASYSLRAFLGDVPTLKNKENKLFVASLHLSPSQYHHFHAPCAFSQTARRHFHGECLPVFKSFLTKFNDVFSVQERVVVVGEWRHGAFNLAAVAASNVGNIRLDKDPDLKTNRQRVVLRHLGGDIDVCSYAEKPLEFSVGDHLGEFRLGSTVVIVFEAPADFSFCVLPGQKLMAGERLGGVGNPVRPDTPEKAKFLHY